MPANDVQGFLSRLPQWSKFFDGYQLPPVIARERGIAELRQRLGNIRRRLRDGPDAPLRIAFFGPTGAGKSKLFGSLIRDNFSGSGFKRPFTRSSFYYVHEDWKPLVATLQGEVSLHNDDAWLDTLLIDTPDFDSVETENRKEAERVFLESDGFLFVTDALKYADASTWEYLRKIHDSGKAFAVILNKVNSSSVSESFRERYQRTFQLDAVQMKQAYPEVVIPEFRIDDATLIDADHECLRELRNVGQSLLGPQPRHHTSVELLGSELQSFFDYGDELGGRISRVRAEISSAREALRRRKETAERHLGKRLTADLEPEVRDEVYRDVISRLERIDVLRYPRKLLAMPVMGIKALLSSWMPQQEAAPSVSEPAFADPISSETFHVLESEVITFADQSRNDICSRPGLEKLIDRETFRTLRIDHGELQQLYIEHHDRFAKWVASHASETAAEITGENKAKFILSQVLFNTVLITAQVSSGGLSPLELGADSVISPLVAKGVSMAIGSEKVKQFEADAHEQHQRSLSELLDTARLRFDSFLDTSCVGLVQLEENFKQISASRAQSDAIVEHFRGVRATEPFSAGGVDKDSREA